MRTLLLAIKSSIYDPDYYQEILNRPKSYSVKYFAGLIFFVALLSSIALTVSIAPFVSGFLGEVAPAALEIYPDDLVLMMDHGALSTNQPEPIFIDPPVRWIKPIKDLGFAHLAVIDTASEITPDRFAFYQTMALISARHIAVFDKGEMRVSAFDPEATFTFTEPRLTEMLSVFNRYKMWVVPILSLIIFIGMIAVRLIQPFFLIVGAVFILLAGRIVFHQKWTYGTSYQIGLHALTLPIIIDAALLPFGYGIGIMPFATTVLMLLVVLANFKNTIPPTPIQEELPLPEKSESMEEPSSQPSADSSTPKTE